MSDVTLDQWANAVLRGLGIKANPENRRAMVGWANAEGGHFHNDARYNPLNTTQTMPGAGNTGTQGNIKVYRSWQQGVKATVKTLRNGNYGTILSALKHGSAEDVASAIGGTRWGTSGSLVQQTIAGTPRIKNGSTGPLPSGQKVSGPAAHPNGLRTQTVTSPGVDNSPLRTQLKMNYLSDRGNPDALLALGYGLQQAQDVPGTTTTKTVRPKQQPANTGGSSGALPVTQRKGVSNFEGTQVAAWIKPILKYARKQGWQGQINSGYRTDAEQKRIYDSGVRPAAVPRAYGGGGSNHEFKAFPGGAIDVSDASTLSSILQKSKYAKTLVYAGAKDPVHFSHPHNGSY